MNPPGETAKVTILVVEHNKAVLNLVALILKDADFEVLRARSASHAMIVEVGFHGPIHLLLSSVTFPETTGPDLAKAMLVRRPEMRVMFMSGYPDGALLVLNYGWQFIAKPFVKAALLEKVKSVLSSTTKPQGVDHFDTEE
jgi:DNA-binding NtrC family response regulator